MPSRRLSPGLTAWARWTVLLAVAALTLWFAMRLAATDWASAGLEATPALFGALGLAALLYGALGLLLALAWARLVAVHGGTPAGQAKLHALSQALKYLPGNVVHLAGRHVAARRRGIPDRVLLAAAGSEAGLLVMSAALVGLLAAPQLAGAAVGGFPAGRTAGIGVAVLMALLVAGALAWRTRFGRFAPALAGVLGLYLMFFLGCACVAAILLRALGLAPGPGDGAASWLALLTGTLAIAWAAGFVTPGAPAGLGVREAVLVLALGPALGEPAALALAALYRLATLGGDLLLAGAAGVVAHATAPLRKEPVP